MTDKTQRLTSYTNKNGFTVYEIEQYNATTGEWYIVGDSTQYKKLAEAQIKLHNALLEEDKRQFFDIYDDKTGKTIEIEADSLEEAIEKSETIDYTKEYNHDKSL